MRAFVTIVGLAILVIAIFVGSSRLQASDGSDNTTVSCGTGFSPSLQEAAGRDNKSRLVGPQRTNLVEMCGIKTESRMMITLGLTGLAAAVALGSLFIPGSRRG